MKDRTRHTRLRPATQEPTASTWPSHMSRRRVRKQIWKLRQAVRSRLLTMEAEFFVDTGYGFDLRMAAR